MKKNLIFWASDGYDEIHSNEIPSSRQACIQENFRSKRGFDFDWVGYNNPTPPPLPKMVYFVIKSIKKPNFEFYDYAYNFMIVSEKLLKFMTKHGYPNCYDKCDALVVNTQGTQLTNTRYFLLRIHHDMIRHYNSLIKFEEIIDIFDKDSTFSRIKQHKQVYTDSEETIFTVNFPFYPALMFSENLEKDIRREFDNARLYNSIEWIKSKQRIADAVGL